MPVGVNALAMWARGNTVQRLLILAIGLWAMTSASAWAQDLTRSMVESVIQSVEDATNHLDAQALADTMADDVVIRLDITMLGESQVITPSKEEYVAVVAEAWSRFDQYHYRRSNTDISLQGDQAVVDAKVHESMVIDGHSVSGTSKERVIIKLINGQPKITEVNGASSM